MKGRVYILFSDPTTLSDANRELWVGKIRVSRNDRGSGSTNFLKAIDCVTTFALSASVQLPDRILTVTDMHGILPTVHCAMSLGQMIILVGKALNDGSERPQSDV